MTAAERRVPVVIGAAEMAEIDGRAEALGLPRVALMENAGRAVAEVAAVELARMQAAHAEPQVVVLCGPGDNGADGFVAARHLAAGGRRVTVVLVGDPSQISGAAAQHNWTVVQAMAPQSIDLAVAPTPQLLLAMRPRI